MSTAEVVNTAELHVYERPLYSVGPRSHAHLTLLSGNSDTHAHPFAPVLHVTAASRDLGRCSDSEVEYTRAIQQY
jgi:hypothetical protein